MGLLKIFRAQLRRRENVNVAAAAYVTTQARLNLYEYLSEFEKSVMYCDTESVIFIQNENDPPPPK